MGGFMKHISYLSVVLLFILATSFTSNAQAVADPASLPVYVTPTPITVDGNLDEIGWYREAPHIMFNQNAVPSGYSNTPTGGAVVKPPYNDVTTTYVKFLRSDMNLYISLNSNDKQVCRFGDSWEGDGIFLKIKDATNADVEYKLYYNLSGTDPDMHYEGPAHSSGAGAKGPGTTVNDSSNVDGGYTAELLISLTGLGYISAPTSIDIMINIFDPDSYSDGVGAWGPNGSYYKQWWGSEWGPTMRTLMLTSETLPVELTSFSAQTYKGEIVLNWKTATETNNKGFEVQRSTDGSSYTTIGFVEGHGTSTNVHEYRFTDPTAHKLSSAYYRLRQVDFSGTFEYSQVIEIKDIAPVDFKVSQNYPNPFNPTTTIDFSIPENSQVTISVYNLIGQKIATLFNGKISAGNHKVDFNAEDLTSGIYVYHFNALAESGSDYSITKKMTLLK